MSINIEDYQSDLKDYCGIFVIVVEGYTSRKAFKELINRGANTWDRAPPEIKSFVDMVNEGKVLQVYETQNSSKRNIKHSLEP